MLNTNASNDDNKDHNYSDKDSLNLKDKRYYSDGYLKSKCSSAKFNKHRREEYLEPDVKSLPTQNFFDNNEIKINIQNDEPLSINLKSPSLNSNYKSIDLNSAKKRFKSEEFIYSKDKKIFNERNNLTADANKYPIKTTKSLANFVSYLSNEQVPFKSSSIKHKTLTNKSADKLKRKNNQNVRLEEPIPSTSTGITHQQKSHQTPLRQQEEQLKEPPEEFLKKALNVSGTFLARNHDDTSIGAVHCFQVCF